MPTYSGAVASISVEDAIEITELCMLAGRPDQIVDCFACRFTPEQVKARLSAAETARPPERPAGRAPAAAASTNDALRDVIEKRFRAQNGRRAS